LLVIEIIVETIKIIPYFLHKSIIWPTFAVN
jgi:hypothetical protein